MKDTGRRSFHYTLCGPCGKRAYGSRKAAREAARHAGKGPMNAYRCPATPEGAEVRWHCGHMPPDVRRGLRPKDEWKARLR